MAQVEVKNIVRRINKKIIQHGSNHVMHVLFSVLFCFSMVYSWSKISKR